MVIAVRTQDVLDSVAGAISLDPDKDIIVQKLVGGLLKHVINSMAEKCFFFALAYVSIYLVGSYRDRIKINMPDEYDFNILIRLPKAVFEYDPEEMGTVKINMSAYKDSKDDLLVIRKCMDSAGFLKVMCLQSYIESLLEQIKITKKPLSLLGYNLRVKIKRSGPAHTFHVHAFKKMSCKLEFDMDFVPAIVFNFMQDDELVAIPKPIKGGGNAENIHFIPSFSKQESDLLKDKQNMKTVLRLIKRIRDHHSINNLKSYYIKTAFLWVNKEKGASYWNKSPDILLEEMLQKIVQYLEERNLPFFWRPKHNMLKKLKISQIDEMRATMASVAKNYKKYQNTILLFDLFFTRKEIQYIWSIMRRRSKSRYAEKDPEDRIFGRRRERSFVDGGVRRLRDEL